MNKPRFKLRPNMSTCNLTMVERHGGKYGNCKLSDEQVRDIKARYAKRGASIRQIAKEVGVCKSTVGAILKGNSYGVVQ